MHQLFVSYQLVSYAIATFCQWFFCWGGIRLQLSYVRRSAITTLLGWLCYSHHANLL